MIFRSGGQGFALPMAELEEVIPCDGMHPLRGTRPEVLGVLVHRRRVVGVVAPGGGTGTGTEVLVLSGTPGLGLLGSESDAVTRGFTVEETEGVLHCSSGSFRLLDAQGLRGDLGITGAPGEDDGKKNPARG